MQFFTPSVLIPGMDCRRRYRSFQKGKIYEVLEVTNAYLVVAHPDTKDPVYIQNNLYHQHMMTLSPAELDLSFLLK